MSDQLKSDMLKSHKWAVVGASTNRQKYGNRVYRCLRTHDYEVYPVNPTAAEVEGDPAFVDVGQLPVVPDVVNMVVPPRIGIEVAKKCNELGIKNIWMQPGAESKEILDYCSKVGINAISHQCVLRELGC